MRASDKLGKCRQLKLWTILAQMFITNELGIFHLKQMAQKIVDTIGTSMTISEIEIPCVSSSILPQATKNRIT